jgi:predicted dehydrogenase
VVRIGLIGTGSISGVHLTYLKEQPGVEIAALCDIRAEALERRRAAFGGQGFRDYRRMLDRVALDAVWLCTPSMVRREMLLACADRGIPVFCEKPVERSLRKAERIAAELQARGARVQVGYVFRSMPIVQKLREAMADDTVDLVQSLYGCPVSRSRKLPSWFFDKRRSGGPLVDQATHNLDLLRTLLGEVVEVCGLAANPLTAKEPGYTIDEVLSLSFRFAGGALGGHVHTWIGDQWRNEMLLVGRKRVYRLDLARGILSVEQGARRRVTEQVQKRMYDHENARFLEQVRSGDWSANPCTYDDGLATLRLTLACDRAVSGTRPVRL